MKRMMGQRCDLEAFLMSRRKSRPVMGEYVEWHNLE